MWSTDSALMTYGTRGMTCLFSYVRSIHLLHTMTSSDINQLIDQSVSSQVVADRLVRLIWTAEYQAALKARDATKRDISLSDHEPRKTRHDLWARGTVTLADKTWVRYNREALLGQQPSLLFTLSHLKARIAALRPPSPPLPRP